MKPRVDRAKEPDDHAQALATALLPHMGRKGVINARSVTSYLGKERDVITDGHRIWTESGHVARFWIEAVKDQPKAELRQVCLL